MTLPNLNHFHSVMAFEAQVAQYLYCLFLCKLEPESSLYPALLALPASIIGECQWMASVIYEAFTHPISFRWSSHEYALDLGKQTGMNCKKEEEMEALFPPLFTGDLPICKDPFVIVDSTGMVLMWQLPSLLCWSRQMAMFCAALSLNPLMRTSGKPQVPGKCGSWRNDPAYFKAPSGQYKVTPGVLNFSPAWFQLGHQGPASSLGVSATLNAKARLLGTDQWLNDTIHSTAIVNAILRVIHPRLYAYGRRGREALLADGMDMNWLSIYTGAAVISNRETPVHRDTQCWVGWYDLLVSAGPYRYAEMVLPSIGIRTPDLPGTLSALSGHTLPHGVSEADGERVCYAFFMRHKVSQRLGLRLAEPMMADHYLRARRSV
ncbi:hypothetical protein JAAARDRAFT_194130 [Jaapia argillacea MUCL 33604]|uniref:2OGFeDO JBP1/TET oxygenase domain-containing protein n=1 Tax=Jaapia argillacea MUCL 33604 TaxID=933084 RepID=A0A067PQ50_9AGAM|nr:hypothetical protein JAAARDRAFT_194130 [Jaapia argillacea MUCL 33604]